MELQQQLLDRNREGRVREEPDPSPNGRNGVFAFANLFGIVTPILTRMAKQSLGRYEAPMLADFYSFSGPPRICC